MVGAVVVLPFPVHYGVLGSAPDRYSVVLQLEALTLKCILASVMVFGFHAWIILKLSSLLLLGVRDIFDAVWPRGQDSRLFLEDHWAKVSDSIHKPVCVGSFSKCSLHPTPKSLLCNVYGWTLIIACCCLRLFTTTVIIRADVDRRWSCVHEILCICQSCVAICGWILQL